MVIADQLFGLWLSDWTRNAQTISANKAVQTKPRSGVLTCARANRSGSLIVPFVDHRMQKPVIEIDGLAFDSLAGFF